MIQRVQSIYLLLAALCGLITFFLPYAHFNADSLKLGEYAMFGVWNVQSDVFELAAPLGFPEWVFGILSVLIPTGALLLFKRRPRQLILVRFGLLTGMAYVCFIFFGAEAAQTKVFPDGSKILYHFGFYLPVISLPFYFLAVRGIRKDEALVRSLDRIR